MPLGQLPRAISGAGGAVGQEAPRSSRIPGLRGNTSLGTAPARPPNPPQNPFGPNSDIFNRTLGGFGGGLNATNPGVDPSAFGFNQFPSGFFEGFTGMAQPPRPLGVGGASQPSTQSPFGSPEQSALIDRLRALFGNPSGAGQPGRLPQGTRATGGIRNQRAPAPTGTVNNDFLAALLGSFR